MEKNYQLFTKYMSKLIGEDKTEKLVEILGGELAISTATYAMTTDTNQAYDGSLLQIIKDICEYAIKINEQLPEEMKVDAKSIYKVGYLSQISKVLFFKQNTNQWEIEKRGMKYTFNKFKTALRIGERSLFICNQVGIEFTEEEYEAMHVIDKMKEEDNYSKYYSTILSTIMKQSIEMTNSIALQSRNI